MILEAVNSVFLTFLVTEFLLFDDDNSPSDASFHNNRHDRGRVTQIIRKLQITLFSRHSTFIQYMIGLVAFINLLAHFHVSGAAITAWINSKVERLFHIPRIFIAIASFLIAMYFDCRRMMKCKNPIRDTDSVPNKNMQQWSNKMFFRQVLKSFCILLPVYPFLAVVISFGFLFIVSIFEKLDLPLEVLNMPIYYGTLYGPLSYLYWDVKKKMAAGALVNGGVRVLDGTVLPR